MSGAHSYSEESSLALSGVVAMWIAERYEFNERQVWMNVLRLAWKTPDIELRLFHGMFCVIRNPYCSNILQHQQQQQQQQ